MAYLIYVFTDVSYLYFNPNLNPMANIFHLIYSDVSGQLDEEGCVTVINWWYRNSYVGAEKEERRGIILLTSENNQLDATEAML